MHVESQYRDLLESSPDATIRLRHGTIVFTTRRTTEMFGYEAEDLLGQRLDFIVPTNHIGKRKDGSEFPVELSFSPWTAPDGSTLVTVNVRDITERQELERHNVALYETAQKAIRARDEIIAIVSHDLKNPLFGVELGIQLLRKLSTSQDNTLSRKMAARQLDRMSIAVKRANELIHNLLDASKFESEKYILNREEHSLPELISEVTEYFHVQAAARDISLIAEINLSGQKAHFDRRRIWQVLTNIIGNAIKFSKHGGKVKIAAVQDSSNEIRVSVSDSGVGIDEKDLPHIFDRYWQSPGKRSQGAGLGLAIAKQIVEAHNGKIWAESKLGEGCTVYFTIPFRLTQ